MSGMEFGFQKTISNMKIIFSQFHTSVRLF